MLGYKLFNTLEYQLAITFMHFLYVPLIQTYTETVLC